MNNRKTFCNMKNTRDEYQFEKISHQHRKIIVDLT